MAWDKDPVTLDEFLTRLKAFHIEHPDDARILINGDADASFASVIYGVVAIALKLAGVALVPGYASLLFVITFLSGIQLAVMGVVGLYVGRIYDEARARPLYIVRESHGFGEKNGPVMWEPEIARGGQRVLRS